MRGTTNAVKGGARVVHEQIVLPAIVRVITSQVIYTITGEYAQSYLDAESLYKAGKCLRVRIKLSSDSGGFDPIDGYATYYGFAELTSTGHACVRPFVPFSNSYVAQKYIPSYNATTNTFTLSVSSSSTSTTTQNTYIAIDLVYLDE